MVELCFLPPCYKNLYLHLKRSIYIACKFKYADLLEMDIEPPSLHGWLTTLFTEEDDQLDELDDLPFVTPSSCSLRQTLSRVGSCLFLYCRL